MPMARMTKKRRGLDEWRGGVLSSGNCRLERDGMGGLAGGMVGYVALDISDLGIK